MSFKPKSLSRIRRKIQEIKRRLNLSNFVKNVHPLKSIFVPTYLQLPTPTYLCVYVKNAML